MAVDWTLIDSSVNAEGNLLSLLVRVTSDEFQVTDVANLAATVNSIQADLIGAINGWRMSGEKELNSSGPLLDAQVPFEVVDLRGPFEDGEDLVVTFTLSIAFRDTGRLAINNAQSAMPTRIADLRVEAGSPPRPWITLVLDRGAGEVEFAAEAFDADTDPELIPDVTSVGKLPAANDGTSDRLKLSVDAHAEAVDLGNGVTHLTLWNDLAPGGSADLTGKPTSDEPELVGGTGVRPHVKLDDSVPGRFDAATTPVITNPATIAAVFIPDTDASIAQVVGRFNSDIAGSTSWRVCFDGSDTTKSVTYQASGSGGGDSVSFDLVTEDTTILFILRRRDDTGKTWEAWINGRPAGDGSFSYGVNTGLLNLTVGGRISLVSNPFNGEINQVGLYDTDLDDVQLSLLMHQMADRAAIDLGTPIPAEWQTQPYLMSDEVATEPPKRLDRRPIAMINLYRADYSQGPGGNLFGQSPDWRNADVEALKQAIRLALVGCDQFEIMFNRPGGRYDRDIVMTYVFGQADDDDETWVITTEQWEAMEELWSYFNLTADNGDGRNEDHHRQRRGWFYTGGGLGVTDNGDLDTTGRMGQRVIGPATPAVYLEHVLENWSNKDDRYRCLFLDAAVQCFGKFVELVHDGTVNQNYVLVGEAIPEDEAALLGAPWFGMAGLPKGPWWNNRDNKQGYNPLWESDWLTTTLYFGVLYFASRPGATIDLHITDDEVGPGDDLKIGDIYSWIRKGATPVAWYGPTYRKVGSAWNYAAGRVLPSRLARCPRTLRCARC
jgi:hypothetical protein